MRPTIANDLFLQTLKRTSYCWPFMYLALHVLLFRLLKALRFEDSGFFSFW